MLGDGATATYRVDELLPVYLPRRAALQRLLDAHLAGGTAVTWEDDAVRACFRCPECATQVRATDDLLLVAGMRVSQRARLIDAGITTMHQLADHTARCPSRCPTRTVKTLTAQARLQVADRESTASRRIEVVDPQPLMVLPDANKGDLFFDFEGDPLWTVDGREWGLEYLWGVLDHYRRVPSVLGARPGQRTPGADRLPGDGAQAAASAIPACTSTTTRPTRRAPCCGWPAATASARTKSTTCSATACSSTCIPLVRKSIRVGTENYSIKSLEPLYMGNELRSGEVTTATDSITQYARYCALRDDGRADEAAIVLKEIEDYNRYDCRSTRRLRDWMMARAIESGVPPRGPQPVRRRRRRSKSATTSNANCSSSPATASRTARPNRPPWRWWRPHAAFTSARTSRSGGATSTASTIPSTNGRTTATSSSPNAPRSSTTGTSRRRRASHSGTCG